MSSLFVYTSLYNAKMFRDLATKCFIVTNETHYFSVNFKRNRFSVYVFPQLLYKKDVTQFFGEV